MLFQNRVPKIGADDPRSREQCSPSIRIGIPSYQRSWGIESLVPDKPKSIPVRPIIGYLDEPAPFQNTTQGDSNPNVNTMVRHNFAPPMRTIATPKSNAKSTSSEPTGDKWWNNLR
jgi:hypothetical protein